MAPLRVAQVAPLWASVPPAHYGGIEQIVYELTDGLVRLGCDVTVFGSGDSRTSATLQPICDQHLLAAMRDGQAESYEPYVNACLAEALAMAADFDVIHCHLGAAYIPFAARCTTPALFWCTRSTRPEAGASTLTCRSRELPSPPLPSATRAMRSSSLAIFSANRLDVSSSARKRA